MSELKPTLISRLNFLKLFLTKVGHGVLSCREGIDRIAAHGAQGPPVRTISGTEKKAIGDKLD